ncbi:MAG: hypothetical protein GF346_04335 [Candidatus Eisenbacteria bacterium]|nr:hypothetical protein [Candidatus Latescibacterota bacterium]MBD3301655.1 hypothetical protein [Candidatus Eisenbacteria bacterium]
MSDGAEEARATDGEERTLEWKVHPFGERRGTGLAVLAGITAFSVGAGLWGGAWFWTLFSFAVLFLSLESFYFPTRYVLSEEKLVVIKRFSRAERAWTVFRRAEVDRRGVTLSPFAKRSFLEAYRAIRLVFRGGNREEVLALLRERLREDVEWTESEAVRNEKGR